MRLLLDECVPRHLRREFSDHEVRTVPEMGWVAKENGELLQLAAESFDVFITVDQRLSYQQDVARFSIASWSLWRNEIRSTSYFLWCLNCDECWQTFSQGKCIGSVSNDRLQKAVRLAHFARMPSLLSLCVRPGIVSPLQGCRRWRGHVLSAGQSMPATPVPLWWAAVVRSIFGPQAGRGALFMKGEVLCTG